MATKPKPSAVNDRLEISRPCTTRGTPDPTNTSGNAMESTTCAVR